MARRTESVLGSLILLENFSCFQSYLVVPCELPGKITKNLYHANDNSTEHSQQEPPSHEDQSMS